MTVVTAEKYIKKRSFSQKPENTQNTEKREERPRERARKEKKKRRKKKRKKKKEERERRRRGRGRRKEEGKRKGKGKGKGNRGIAISRTKNGIQVPGIPKKLKTEEGEGFADRVPEYHSKRMVEGDKDQKE
ncbi:hypothetical protein ACOSQ3_010728 [Xanthoceras sorbifolium]